MRILKILAVTLLGLVLILVVGGLLLPAQVHVERSQQIAAAPERVFSLIDNFHEFNRWSPWAARDPHTQYRFEGPDRGVGAKMSWQSDSPEVGSGSQEIIVSEPPRLLRTRLDFAQQGLAEAAFKLQPENGGTQVTWGLDSDAGGNLIGRWFGLLLDTLVGADYEQGLANLKRLAEQEQ